MLAEQIAHYCLDSQSISFNQEVVHSAKRQLLDALGCALGGWHSQTAQVARKYALLSRGDATLLGTNQKTSIESAAFANGAAIRYLDYNDTYLSLEPAHPSDNIAALLAGCELYHKGGLDLLKSMIVAYQVQLKFCDAFSIRSKGWDHVTYGAFSTVAGLSILKELSLEQLIHALSISGVMSAAMRQTRVGELSMWKGCAFANASRNGVFSFELAHLGMTGPSQIFEGSMGFFSQVSRETFGIESFMPSEGELYKIQGSYIKYHPAEYHSQSAIDAALKIIEKHERKLRCEDIKEIKIETFKASYEIIGGEPEKWKPQSRETADHSLPYVTCVALIDGKITQKSFDENRFKDPLLLSLLERTSVVCEESFTALYPEKGIPNRITVTLYDGTRYQEEVHAPYGHALNTISDKDIENKFRFLADGLLSEKQIKAIYEMVWNLEELETLDPLFKLLIVQK